MLNAGNIVLMADVPVELICPDAAVVRVIETSIDDLLEAGWRTFGVDVCRWEGDAPVIVASSVLECVAPRGRTVKTLERMAL
jgi:carbohydrate-binding DOMON domain-containing protein